MLLEILVLIVDIWIFINISQLHVVCNCKNDLTLKPKDHFYDLKIFDVSNALIKAYMLVVKSNI